MDKNISVIITLYKTPPNKLELLKQFENYNLIIFDQGSKNNIAEELGQLAEQMNNLTEVKINALTPLNDTNVIQLQIGANVGNVFTSAPYGEPLKDILSDSPYLISEAKNSKFSKLGKFECIFFCEKFEYIFFMRRKNVKKSFFVKQIIINKKR